MIQSKSGWATFYAVFIASAFTIASFWNTDGEVYFFPRIIALLMLLLASIQLVNQLITNSNDEDSNKIFSWSTLAPGLVIGIIYVLLMEKLGFYLSSFICFITLISIYGKRRAFDFRALSYKVLVGIIFTAILYALFWKLLNVRTPTGILF